MPSRRCAVGSAISAGEPMLVASHGSFEVMWRNSSAGAVTPRGGGPAGPRDGANATPPWGLPAPWGGSTPTTPHTGGGGGIEPPVSVPSAHGALPAATAAALPPLEPPGTRARSHGLSTGPKAEFSFDEPIANSSWFVFPSSGAPASARLRTTVAVYGGR